MQALAGACATAGGAFAADVVVGGEGVVVEVAGGALTDTGESFLVQVKVEAAF